MDERGLLSHFRKLMFDVFEDLHWIVLAVKDFCHDFHVAFGDALFVPQFFKVCEGLVDGFFLPLLIFAVVGLIADFVCVTM